MAWTIEYHPQVEKDLKAIDRTIQREILDYMDARIAGSEDPRRFGKSLRHEFRGLWRHRVRDYRVICDVQDQRRVVFVLTDQASLYELRMKPRRCFAAASSARRPTLL